MDSCVGYGKWAPSEMYQPFQYEIIGDIFVDIHLGNILYTLRLFLIFMTHYGIPMSVCPSELTNQ